MKKILCVAIAASVLAGCVSPVPSMYNNATISLVGKNKSDAMTQLGIPTRTMAINASQTMMQWDSDQGNTSSFGGNAETNSFAAGGLANGVGNGVVGASNSNTSFSGGSNQTTHVCALSLVVDNASDKILSGRFNGTVDDKCFYHFRSVVTLDPNAVQANKDMISHNNHVQMAQAAALIIGTAGLGIAAYNHK
ncbi:TPA: hypothetical protein ML375_002935 [Klebsiella variicola]|nr:hypothetical protein [Klebsiella variicola]